MIPLRSGQISLFISKKRSAGYSTSRTRSFCSSYWPVLSFLLREITAYRNCWANWLKPKAEIQSVLGRTQRRELGIADARRAAYEREFILRKLEEHQWNMTHTASALGLERSHLYRKMKSLGISSAEQ